MAKSKSPTKRTIRPIRIAFILAFVLPIFAGLFFKDYLSVPFGWFIGALWALATVGALTFGVLYYAQFVLPAHEGESWWEGVLMIWSHVTQNVSLPEAFTVRQRTLHSSLGPGVEELPQSFINARAGVLRSHTALALGRGNGFSRAGGPGFVRLRSGEKIVQAIDLRTHSRSQKMSAMTRDAIPLTIAASVTFKIRDLDERPENDRRPYTYDPNAVFQASQASSIDANDEIIEWSEQLAPQAAAYLASAVAQHQLNDLLSNPNTLSEAKKRIENELKQQFAPQGIEVLGVSGSITKLPDDVDEMRLKNWSAPWERQVQAKYAAANAEAVRRMKRARARAQIEIIQNIVTSIDEMRRHGNDNLTQIVTLRMIEALEDAMDNNTLQAIVPKQILARMVMDTTGQMRNLLPPNTEENESE